MPGFVHHERVRFGDLDAMRHVNNAVFLRYFESARISYLGELQVHDPVTEVEAGFGLIFAECHIKYRSPGRVRRGSRGRARDQRCSPLVLPAGLCDAGRRATLR